MRCLTGCFGLGVTDVGHKGRDESKGTSAADEDGRPVTSGRCAEADTCAEQLDLVSLVALLTGEVQHGDWWDILQSASTALTTRLPADHASIYMIAGAGVAALATSGAPLFGLRLGQLLLPNGTYSTGTSSEDSSPFLHNPDMDVCFLAAALQNQTASVPLVFRSVDISGRHNQQQQQAEPQQQKSPSEQRKMVPGAVHAPGTACSRRHDGSDSGARSKQQLQGNKHQKIIATATPAVPGGDRAPNMWRHYVAVAIPGGKSAAGMFILSITGPSPPAAWRAEALGMVAALLAPLLRPSQVPLTRRTLAELHATSTINELVHALSAAAADLLLVAVRVALQPRVALLRNDGTAAAVFAVPESVGVSGTPVCRRRSRDVVLVDAGGSGYGCNSFKAPDFFMLGQPSLLGERDSLGTCVAGVGGGGGGVAGATGYGTGPGGSTLGNKIVSVPGGGPECRGQSMPLQHTLLAEALTRGSGLCISDCNAYVQDSKAFPRDLMVFPKGVAAPAQSLALATSCHCGKPLLALYATYHSILPQALLQTVVQELGQLLRALTPTVAALLLPGGPMAEEWSLLHDDLLGPANVGLTVGTVGRSRTSNPTALASQSQAAEAAAATAAAAAAAVVGAVARPAAEAEMPRGGSQLPPVMVAPAGGGGDDGLAVDYDGTGSTAASPICGGGRSPRSSAGGPPGTPFGNVVAQIGAFFRRSTANGSGRPQNNGVMTSMDSPRGAAATAVGFANRAVSGCGADGGGAAAAAVGGSRGAVATEAVITAMTAAAAALGEPAGAAAEVDGRGSSTTTASKRLAAFVSGGGAGAAGVGGAGVGVGGPASGATPVGGCLRSGVSRTALAHSHTGRTSFSLEAAGSPRGGVRLAPLITNLHDRLKSAQAEQLTASSRAASRIQDLESLRFLERVGKGGYGSVYRGLYHGSEVAIKVVEDPNPALGQLATGTEPGAGTGAANRPTHATAAAAAAAAVTLRAKHLHDAIELVASVSMSHPNIVQLITYFVDVRAQHHHAQSHQRQLQRMRGDAACGGGNSGGGGGDANADASGGGAGRNGDRPGGGGGGGGGAGDCEPGLPHLVHLTSSGMDSTNSSFTETGGNEAIVLVMEYCDRGSLKDAIQDGSFMHREALAQVQMLARQQQQQQQQQPGSQQQQQAQAQAQALLSRGSMQLINLKAVYSTLLEVALALRHMHGLHMVHCDLKPQNVLLKSSPRDPRGFTAKLSDFGLAKMMAHDDDGQLVISEGIQSGTITHLPPEALQGCRQLGPAVDVYAFGIVMFQMLCGMTVYRGMDVKQMIRGVVRHALRPVLPGWVPPEYRELAQRCWHEQAACRPTSLQLVSELEALLEACDASGWPPSRRSPGIGGSLGTVRVGIGGYGGTASHRRLPPRCATETSIQAKRQQQQQPVAASPAPPASAAAAAPDPTAAGNEPAAMVTAAAATRAVAVAMPVPAPAPVQPIAIPALAHPPFFLYQPPQQLYQPTSLEPRSLATPFNGAGTGAPSPLPQPLPTPTAGTAAVAAAVPTAYPGRITFMLPMFGSTGGGTAGGAGRTMTPHAPLAAVAVAPPAMPGTVVGQPPPSLYNRAAGVAVQAPSPAPPPVGGATATAAAPPPPVAAPPPQPPPPPPELQAMVVDPGNLIWSGAAAPRTAARSVQKSATALAGSAAATGTATATQGSTTTPTGGIASTLTSPTSGAGPSLMAPEPPLDGAHGIREEI